MFVNVPATKVTNKRDKSYITRPFKITLKVWWQYCMLRFYLLFIFISVTEATTWGAGPRFEPQNTVYTEWRFPLSDVHPISRTKLQCTLLWRGKMHSLYLISTVFVLCDLNPEPVHTAIWATLHPNELPAASYWAILLPIDLLCNPMSYSLRRTELLCTQNSYSVPKKTTLYPIELILRLMSYAAP